MSDSDEASSQGDPSPSDELSLEVDNVLAEDVEKLGEASDVESSVDGDDNTTEEVRLMRDIRNDAIFDEPIASDTESEEALGLDSEGDTDVDTSDDDEEGFERITEEMRENNLESFHPCIHTGTDEFVQAKCVILRKANGQIDDPNHRTLPLLSKYERTKIIGMRAAQLASGSAPLVKRDEQNSPFDLAILELNAKVLPFIIKRPLPSGQCEYWKLEDLHY